MIRYKKEATMRKEKERISKEKKEERGGAGRQKKRRQKFEMNGMGWIVV